MINILFSEEREVDLPIKCEVSVATSSQYPFPPEVVVMVMITKHGKMFVKAFATVTDNDIVIDG